MSTLNGIIGSMSDDELFVLFDEAEQFEARGVMPADTLTRQVAARVFKDMTATALGLSAVGQAVYREFARRWVATHRPF